MPQLWLLMNSINDIASDKIPEEVIKIGLETFQVAKPALVSVNKLFGYLNVMNL